MTKKRLAAEAALQHRRHVNLRMERWHRWAVYLSFAWLLATGALFLVAHYFLHSAADAGEMPHPLQPVSMRLHGAGAMVALFFIGSLMNSHIRRAIKSGRNFYSGCLMIVALLILTITGYGLYYVAGDTDRGTWSAVHWVIGLALGATLAAHVFLGRRSRET